MRASDYIVEFLIEKEIKDVFGHPEGMVTQIVDFFRMYSDRIAAHVTYHEQGAAFAACGYAQTSGKSFPFCYIPSKARQLRSRRFYKCEV